MTDEQRFADVKAALAEGRHLTNAEYCGRWGLSKGEVSKTVSTWIEAGLVRVSLVGNNRRCVTWAADRYQRVLGPKAHALGLLECLVGADGDGFAAGDTWPVGVVYRAYREWAEAAGVQPISEAYLVQALLGNGCLKAGVKLGRCGLWRDDLIWLPERMPGRAGAGAQPGGTQAVLALAA